MPVATTAFDRVLHAVEQATGNSARGNGRQRSARCPAHDDSNPSLSITRGSDRVLLHCHGGCDTDDVLTAAGLTRTDLYDEPLEPRRSHNEIVATYDYHDEHGQLLYQVCRMHPKSFRQRRPDPTGGWLWKMGETRRVLYKLPHVLKAVADEHDVYVCEGEKDVHAIEAAGGHATCNPGGAGKWRPEYAQALAGANVIIVADTDQPGRDHAATVAVSVQTTATS
ncbi:MAG: hypothetical protein ACRDP4_07965, partial [Nocardioidaceae bacterium]